MEEIIKILNRIFTTRVISYKQEIWYNGKRVDKLPPEAEEGFKKMDEGFEKMEQAFKEMNKAFNSLWKHRS